MFSVPEHWRRPLRVTRHVQMARGRGLRRMSCTGRHWHWSIGAIEVLHGEMFRDAGLSEILFF